MNRREFLKTMAAAAGSAALITATGCRINQAMTKKQERKIQTVRGPIRPSEFGFALVHEHVMVDFVGADKVSPDRYDADVIFETMLPLLKDVRNRGVTGFVDCTPPYLGRDAKLLRRFSDAADIHIVTPTGYYGAAKDKFIPAHAYTETADQLAGRWIAEFDKGIDGTEIRPGFIKIGVDQIDSLTDDDNHGLSEIDAKLVRAAARAYKQTGLRVASHTGQGLAALAQIAIFENEGVNPSALIIVHADSEPDQSFDAKIASKGSWLEFDSVMGKPADYYANRIKAALNYEDRILLSMDAGCYEVGKPGGGNIRNYNYVPDIFLPALQKNGISEPTIRKFTVLNPASAFAIS